MTCSVPGSASRIHLDSTDCRAWCLVRESIRSSRRPPRIPPDLAHRVYVQQLALAQAAISERRLSDAHRYLDDTRERMRGWEWRYLEGQIDESVSTLVQGHRHIEDLAVDPLQAMFALVVTGPTRRMGRPKLAIGGLRGPDAAPGSRPGTAARPRWVEGRSSATAAGRIPASVPPPGMAGLERSGILLRGTPARRGGGCRRPIRFAAFP